MSDRWHLRGPPHGADGADVRRVEPCASANSVPATSRSPKSPSAPGSPTPAAWRPTRPPPAPGAAFDAGITFFDTANVYGRGAAETAWGEILADYPREEYVLATKVYFPMSDTDRGLSPAQIAKQIDASLQRLRTDHVDLYQCHRFDSRTPIEDTMEALAEVVRAGKARYIGFSEWTPDQIRAGLEAAPSDVTFVSSQPQYSMLWRAPEDEVFDVCREHDISHDRLVAARARACSPASTSRARTSRSTRAPRATR